MDTHLQTDTHLHVNTGLLRGHGYLSQRFRRRLELLFIFGESRPPEAELPLCSVPESTRLLQLSLQLLHDRDGRYRYGSGEMLWPRRVQHLVRILPEP
jgi:hypothetical protein